jgi:hypothetical protein
MNGPGIAGTGVRDDEADVQTARAFDDRLKGSLGDQVDWQDARLDAVLRRQLGGDLPQTLLAPRDKDGVQPVRGHLARELLADPGRRTRDERPRAVRVVVDLLHRFAFQTSSRAGGASGAAAGSPRELSVRSAINAAAARKMLAASNARV